MFDPLADVILFHRKYAVPILPYPGVPSSDRIALRKELLKEEQEETFQAMDAGDLEKIADGLADLAYIVYGTALEFGIDLRSVFAEVQRSNMTKTPGLHREDGKVMKGPDFQPPDIARVLADQCDLTSLFHTD